MAYVSPFEVRCPTCNAAPCTRCKGATGKRLPGARTHRARDLRAALCTGINPRKYACPRCDAEPEQPCTDGRGKLSDGRVHPERRLAAAQLLPIQHTEALQVGTM